MGMGAGDTAGPGVQDPDGRPDDGGSEAAGSSLLFHPAVEAFGLGTPPAQLNDFVRELARRANERVGGVGQEQYGKEEVQRYETYTLEQEYDELLAELIDAINYIGFIAIQVGNIVRGVAAARDAGREYLALLEREQREAKQ